MQGRLSALSFPLNNFEQSSRLICQLEQKLLAADVFFELPLQLLAILLGERMADDLPDSLRSAFVGNALDMKTFREMSEESGVPMGTLMARKKRAVEMIREQLRRQGLIA